MSSQSLIAISRRNVSRFLTIGGRGGFLKIEMQSDEQLYELAAKELTSSPRQGLLIKCMTYTNGDENKGKALYIKTRVEEMKVEIRRSIQQMEEASKPKKDHKEEKTIFQEIDDLITFCGQLIFWALVIWIIWWFLEHPNLNWPWDN